MCCQTWGAELCNIVFLVAVFMWVGFDFEVCMTAVSAVSVGWHKMAGAGPKSGAPQNGAVWVQLMVPIWLMAIAMKNATTNLSRLCAMVARQLGRLCKKRKVIDRGQRVRTSSEKSGLNLDRYSRMSMGSKCRVSGWKHHCLTMMPDCRGWSNASPRVVRPSLSLQAAATQNHFASSSLVGSRTLGTQPCWLRFGRQCRKVG